MGSLEIQFSPHVAFFCFWHMPPKIWSFLGYCQVKRKIYLLFCTWILLQGVSQQVWDRLTNLIKVFERRYVFFTNMYFRSLKLCKSHFLLTAKKKCLLLCNLPYVIIYLVNMKTIA